MKQWFPSTSSLVLICRAIALHFILCKLLAPGGDDDCLEKDFPKDITMTSGKGPGG